jgi:hypothetical protein
MHPDQLPPALQTVIARVVKAERRRADRQAENARREVYAALGEVLVKAIADKTGAVVDDDEPAEPDTLDWILKAGRSGLVQKKIKYTRGGKTYERMQWVRSGDAISAAKPAGVVKTAAPRASYSQRQESRKALEAAVSDLKSLTAEQLPALKAHIEALTVPELKGLAKSLAQKMGGKKADLAARVADAFRANAKAAPVPQPAAQRPKPQADKPRRQTAGEASPARRGWLFDALAEGVSALNPINWLG